MHDFEDHAAECSGPSAQGVCQLQLMPLSSKPTHLGPAVRAEWDPGQCLPTSSRCSVRPGQWRAPAALPPAWAFCEGTGSN